MFYLTKTAPFLIGSLLLFSGPASADHALQSDPLEVRFADPPASTRILKIVHTVPATPEKQDLLLQNLREQGFGGMATNVPLKDGYVENEENWTTFLQTVRRAHEAGMTLWLYDEKGYPSGTAGGITLREHPEWEAQGLYCAETTTNGGAVSLELPPGAIISVCALPVQGGIADLSKKIDLAPQVTQGRIGWQAPEGAWRIMAITRDRLYEGTHATSNLFAKQPYINLLMPQPTDRFLDVTHAAYARRLGDDFSRCFVSTFTDEPSLMSLFMEKKPWRPIPWAPEFAEHFKQWRGYDLVPLLAELFTETGPQALRTRYDFWQTVSELTAENFFGRIQTWCGRHGILSGGHLLSEESVLTHVPFYGDFFHCARRLDAPSIDVLTSIPEEVPWYIARFLSSVAELEGRTETMSETSDHSQRWRGPGDTRPVRVVTEDEIRGTINRQIVNGITTFTSYYSFAGLTGEQLQRLNAFVGRCATAMRGGRQVTDIAVVYPVQSIWPKFLPSFRWVDEAPESAKRVADTYRGVSETLFRKQRDFTYIDAQALCEGEAKDGRFHCGDLSWRLIVLPCVDTLPQNAWHNLAQFWRAGGIVIALGALPANNEKEFPSPAVQAFTQEVFGADQPGKINANAQGGAGVFVPAGEESRVIQLIDQFMERDVQIEPADSPLRYTHRRISEKDIYMLINDSASPWEGKITFCAMGPGRRLDPSSGNISTEESPDKIPVRLDPYGAVLFQFPQSRLPQRR